MRGVYKKLPFSNMLYFHHNNYYWLTDETKLKHKLFPTYQEMIRWIHLQTFPEQYYEI